MTLDQAKEGDRLVVKSVANKDIVWQALRFGINEGAKIRLQKNISGGPVIIAKNELEIAIGRQFAKSIEVTKYE